MSRGMPRPFNCCDPNSTLQSIEKPRYNSYDSFHPIPKASNHHQRTFPARWEAKLSSKTNLSTLPESQAAAETSLDKGVEGKLSRKAYSKERLKGKLRTIARPKMGVEAKVTYESYLI